ncbi:bifunctional riboflavin kinase/FAD synthetase [Yimella sp. cx-573]|nr:bifunctional riboflavin kinase/FAD synthetase [Yimella sp. cx-573]
MLELTRLEDVPADLGPTVVTMGNFDGVHRGHQALLERVTDLARARCARSVAVTFDPHPIAVLRPDEAPEQLCDLPTRLVGLSDAGLDATLVLEFTRQLAAMTPEEFVREVFVDTLHAVAVACGKDTRFGVRNSGDVDTLRELGQTYGFEVVVLDDVGGDRRFSSTRVRQALAEGDVTEAAQILGRPHSVTGMVVHGFERGRELGFPTANLAQDATGLVPADGVYAGYLLRPSVPVGHPDRRMPAAISVGTNPTFDGTKRTVEAYVIDRTDLDLYDEVVTVEFVRRLRGTVKFEGIEALIDQMTLDVDHAREICPQTSV